MQGKSNNKIKIQIYFQKNPAKLFSEAGTTHFNTKRIAFRGSSISKIGEMNYFAGKP